MLASTARSGIAVGMATNIPPTTVGEVCDALVHLIDNPDATTERLMRHIKGPDFPTGAKIRAARESWTPTPLAAARVIMEAEAGVLRRTRNNRATDIVTSLPYQLNKAHPDRANSQPWPVKRG